MHYTDFLKDKRFVRWQLAPDDQLEQYWIDFIDENPHLEEELNKAVHYLKNSGLNKSSLSEEDKYDLLLRIKNSVSHNNRSKSSRRIIFTIASAAIAAMFVVVLGINIYFNMQDKSASNDKEEFIVGSLLESEDIQLISENKYTVFEVDIEMNITEEGKVSVTKGSSSNEDIDLADNVLNKLIVPYGKRTQLSLSDGTKVWLNSGTVLEFPTRFSGESRDIFLVSGEIFVDATTDKQKPFYVHSNDFQVKVYGTSFNINAYAESAASVVLVNGSVSLKSDKKSDEIFINPSQKATFSDDGTFKTQAVDVERFISWKNGYLTFDDAPMLDVLKQIGRYYNFSFDFAQDVNIQKRTCTGKIYLSENVENVLAAISLLTSTKYDKENNKIYIK